MKEDFLHYVWQYKKFDIANLVTIHGESIQILHSGNYTKQSGPDFFNAQIVIKNQQWAGNVEIHIKSSDWYLHNHQLNQQYENVILHVVWEYDSPLFHKNNIEVPVLELKNYVDIDLLSQYQELLHKKSWINCQNQTTGISSITFINLYEKLYIERLEQKTQPVIEILKQTNNDWEATLFCLLAKNFGLNINGESFLQLAQSIPFTIIRKESFDPLYLEALLFGQASLIPFHAVDNYTVELKSLYEYLVLKYKIKPKLIAPFEFFKLRPDNFPTIRIAQLAMLYHKQSNLFSKIINAKTLMEIYQIMNVNVSPYWQRHYNFAKSSKSKPRSLSKSFIDLLIINTILPIKFMYSKKVGDEISDNLISFSEKINPEKNIIIQNFLNIGFEAKNAFHTQSLIQLKKEYCNRNKCLQCNIGLQILKKQ